MLYASNMVNGNISQATGVGRFFSRSCLRGTSWLSFHQSIKASSNKKLASFSAL